MPKNNFDSLQDWKMHQWRKEKRNTWLKIVLTLLAIIVGAIISFRQLYKGGILDLISKLSPWLFPLGMILTIIGGILIVRLILHLRWVIWSTNLEKEGTNEDQNWLRFLEDSVQGFVYHWCTDPASFNPSSLDLLESDFPNPGCIRSGGVSFNLYLVAD